MATHCIATVPPMVPQNFNGPIVAKVVGIGSTEKCCEACATSPKCIRWVWEQSTKQCNLLSDDGFALIGGEFQSGHVTPGYDAPQPQWGWSFLVGLGIVAAVYLFGGMVRPVPMLCPCLSMPCLAFALTSPRARRPSRRTAASSKALGESTWCRIIGFGPPCPASS